MFQKVCFEGIDALLEVFAEAFPIEGGLCAVIVAYIENIKYVRQVTTVETFYHKHLGIGVNSNGYCVVQYGWRVVSAPVYRINAHDIGRTYNRLYIFEICNRIIAYHSPAV